MQAVILAGGQGTRLRPLTDKVPKPMVPVNGKPFVEHQLDLLGQHGIRDVVFLVGYRAEQIVGHFQDGSAWALRIRYSVEATPLGTGGALKNAEGLLGERFLVLNGDTFLQLDYGCLVRDFLRSERAAMMVVYDNAARIAPNNVRVDERSTVVAYNKKNPRNMTHLDAGVLALRRDVLGLIARARAVSLEEEIFPELIRRGEMAGFPCHERFYDIGSFAGLECLRGHLR